MYLKLTFARSLLFALLTSRLILSSVCRRCSLTNMRIPINKRIIAALTVIFLRNRLLLQLLEHEEVEAQIRIEALQKALERARPRGASQAAAEIPSS